MKDWEKKTFLQGFLGSQIEENVKVFLFFVFYAFDKHLSSSKVAWGGKER